MTRKRALYILAACTIAVNLCLGWLAANRTISTRAFGIGGLTVFAAFMAIGFLVLRRLPAEKVTPQIGVRAMRQLILLYIGFGVLVAVRGALNGWTSDDTFGLMMSTALITMFVVVYRKLKKQSGK